VEVTEVLSGAQTFATGNCVFIAAGPWIAGDISSKDFPALSNGRERTGGEATVSIGRSNATIPSLYLTKMG
jgi:hypothetical protein